MKVGLSIGGGVRALKRIEPRHLVEDGFSSVFLACHEREMLWHAPRMADFTRACQAAGLEVYAVPLGYGRVMDPDPSIDSLYMREYPGNCQVDNRGRRCAKACPNNPAFLEWFSSNMRTLAWLLECRGFVWDEPSFYYARGAWGCRCHYCKRLYFAQHQRELPVDMDDSVVRFRRTNLLMFLLAAAAAIQSVDRRLSSIVMPSAVMTARQAGIGTDDWGGAPGSSAVDQLSVYASWGERQSDMATAIHSIHEAVATAAGRYGKSSLLWIAGSPAPRDRLLDAMRMAHVAGVEHLVIAGYQSLVASPEWERFRGPMASVIAQLS